MNKLIKKQLQFKQPQLQYGVSMIELMIVIAIAGIIISLAAPSFQSGLEKSKLTAAAEALYGDLVFTRSEAIKQNGNVTIQIEATNPTGWCYGLDDNAATACHCTTTPANCTINTIQKTNSITNHPNITLTTLTGAATGDISITFDEFGKKEPLSAATTITLTLSGNTESITINEVGRIKFN